MKPSIALIINTYDQPDYLRRVLRAVSGQASPPAEVVLADDGSDERTAQTFKEWAAAHSGRRYPKPGSVRYGITTKRFDRTRGAAAWPKNSSAS